MKSLDTKRLFKEFNSNLKEMKDKEVKVERVTIIRRPKINEKYVSKSDYKELVALYDIIKQGTDFNFEQIENMIEENSKKCPFLFKCYQSIYDFVNELKCNGPYYIAKEMCRQGKDADYINKLIEERESKRSLD